MSLSVFYAKQLLNLKHWVRNHRSEDPMSIVFQDTMQDPVAHQLDAPLSEMVSPQVVMARIRAQRSARRHTGKKKKVKRRTARKGTAHGLVWCSLFYSR